jgi:CubicO group peptidase (beta-lactamase class C family)
MTLTGFRCQFQIITSSQAFDYESRSIDGTVLAPSCAIDGSTKLCGLVQFLRRFKVVFVTTIEIVKCVGLAAACLVASPYPAGGAGMALPRSSPEAQAVSSSGIRAYVETADQKVNTMHSFLLVRHGYVVAEGWWKPEAAEKPHVMHSLSKSFTSTAVGLAIADGKLSLDDPVLKFFPEEAPANPSEKLKAMRVRDLLTMNSGHEVEVKFPTNAPWVQSFLAHPVPHKPGTHFLYNTPGTHVLSAIVGKVTGETVLDYLKPRLFEPLGIENPVWATSPQGNTLGGWGLYIRTEDIAKFGQLYLQHGNWKGKQLVPASWVAEATAKQVSNGSDPAKDWDQGYGFQFWRCRHGAYRGDGANGQFCIVMPEQDAVIAITADTRDMQAELNVVWDKLLPAIHSTALPADPVEEMKLKTTLASLEAHDRPAIGKTQ